MAYNIFEGGASHGDRLEAILGLVEKQRPDVLALDECNGFADDGLRILYDAERRLGMRGILAEVRTGFHIALFVRDIEILAAHRMTDWFHHGALRVELRHPRGAVTVIATHLCPFSAESRVREAQYISSYVRHQHVVVMGDMNSISRWDAGQLDLTDMLPHRRCRHFVPGTNDIDTRAMDVFEGAGLVDLWHRAHPGESGRTLPTPLVDGTQEPVLRVDYILATAPLAEKLRGCTVITDEAARTGSDHFPLVADIDF